MSYEQYIEVVSAPGTWAGKHEAQLGLQVLVHISRGKIMEFNPEGSIRIQPKRAMALSPEEVDPALLGFKRLRKELPLLAT